MWGRRPARSVKRYRLRRRMRQLAGRVHPDPVYALGNQKSGTTAIAALLAEHTGVTATLDLKRFTPQENDGLLHGTLSVQEFIRHHRRDFAADLVKEPALTFLWPAFRQALRQPRTLFIVRDPRSNIRSILNRVDRPGNADGVADFQAIPVAWQRVIDNRWLGIPHTHFIDSMAARWNLAVDIYERHRDEMLLVRYEDFTAAKAATIGRLADAMGFEHRRDISHRVDVPFQRVGDRKVTPEDFFGRANLERIERLCAGRMERFGYAPTT